MVFSPSVARPGATLGHGARPALTCRWGLTVDFGAPPTSFTPKNSHGTAALWLPYGHWGLLGCGFCGFPGGGGCL